MNIPKFLDIQTLMNIQQKILLRRFLISIKGGIYLNKYMHTSKKIRLNNHSIVTAVTVTMATINLLVIHEQILNMIIK
jgi:hypothetical protein